jgi:hypothetical protein
MTLTESVRRLFGSASRGSVTPADQLHAPTREFVRLLNTNGYGLEGRAESEKAKQYASPPEDVQ